MKVVLAALIFVISGNILLAQDGPTVVVFNSSESKEPGYWSKDNLVKFGVLDAFAGDFSFYYERLVYEKASFEIGFGPTLSNYASRLWNDNLVIGDENYEPLMGFSFLLGGRYYPYRAADEFYVAPEFKFKKYHNNMYYLDSLGERQSVEESQQLSIGRLTFGYVYFFDDNIFIDYSAGFGIGKVKNVDFVQQIDDMGMWEYTTEERSTLVPRFHIGVKVGIAF